MMLPPGKAELFNEGQISELLISNHEWRAPGKCEVLTNGSTAEYPNIAFGYPILVRVKRRMTEVINTGSTTLEILWI